MRLMQVVLFHLVMMCLVNSKVLIKFFPCCDVPIMISYEIRPIAAGPVLMC